MNHVLADGIGGSRGVLARAVVMAWAAAESR